jgi:hypothetical protein
VIGFNRYSILDLGGPLGKEPGRGRDLRAYSRSTFIRLGAFGVIIIFVVGNILIRLIYGPDAVRLSLACMSVALIPGVLIIALMALMNWIVKRARSDGSDPD